MPLINHAVLRQLMAEFDTLTSSPTTEPKRQERLEDVQYTLCVYTGIHDPHQAVAWARSGPAVLRTAEQVYTGQCAACHATGAANAPKFGDTAAWAPRIATGFEALLNSALKGKGAMAAQSGGEYSDFEISRAVVYMANQAGGKLEEPKAPAAAASAASAPN